MSAPLRIYIATTLSQAESHHKPLADALRALGHVITYDWTLHGSVQGEGEARIAEVARAEMDGVTSADLLIALLPGGRGTHTEIGIALASGVPVLIVGWASDFTPPVAFYHAPGVKGLLGYPLDALSVIDEYRPRDRRAPAHATASKAREVLWDALQPGDDRDGLTVLGLAEMAAERLGRLSGLVASDLAKALGISLCAQFTWDSLLAMVRDRSRPLHLQLGDAATAARHRAAALEAARDVLRGDA